MRRIAVTLTVILVFAGGCDPDRVFEKNTRIPDGIWNVEQPVRFELVVEDTIHPHNLYVNIRHTSLYPFSNLHLKIRTTAPSGDAVEDRFELTLADDRGKWQGSGLGDIWDFQQLYKRNVRFAQKGRYVFEYTQDMRPDHLPFILDVGLRVEKAR
jgi:gliding motility-associated lipoprotein GldH